MRPLHALLALGLSACAGPAAPSSSASPDAGAQAPSPPPAAVVTPRPEAPVAPQVREPRMALRERVEARAGDVVSVTAGPLYVGSRPGTRERRPSVEADLVSVTLPAFDIDRLPYPNDPAQPLRLAATRREAEALCAERGRRLCTELEWERACRGETRMPFATGEALELSTCLEDATACPSPLGVMDLGFRAPEWTSSDAEPALSRLERTAVVRGARPDDGLALHRCGARQVKDPSGGGPAAAFRCCGGEPAEQPYPDVGTRRPFRDLEPDPDVWRGRLRTMPEVAAFAEGFVPYGEPEALRALARGDATEADMQWELARGPFAWSPSPGEEVWLVAGSAGERTVLVAMYPMPDGTVIHAASFVLADEVAPVALLRTRAERREVIWSTCWGCMGESGVFRFEDDATLVALQR